VATSGPGPEERHVVIRRLATPEEYRAAEDVQRLAWGLSSDGPVPAPIQRAMNDNGGLLLGAFDGAALVGMSLGFLGREGAKLYHYSHMTGVRPEYQNQKVGYRLKLAQRAEVLAQELDEIRWTFDPLQSRNAFLNVRLLGGRPDRYHVRYYGTMADALNEGLETDRLRLVWRLHDARVEARARGELPSSAEDEQRWRASTPLLETALGPTGLRRPAAVHAVDAPLANLEIPADLGSVRTRDPGTTRRWREATREAFTRAFDQGYRVDDFAVVSAGTERRSFYFLSRGGTSDGT
jgi:chorismate synthase